MMLHQTALMTWLVNTAGVAAAWLLGPPLVAAVVGAVIGEPGFIGVGGFIGLVAFVMCLSTAAAPVPTRTLLDLANGDPDEDDDADSGASRDQQ